MRLFVSLVLLASSQFAYAGLKAITCQYGNSPELVFTVVEINGTTVRYEAPDEEDGISDFVGQATEIKIGEIVEIEAKTRGLDAWRFLRVNADLKQNIVIVEQSELDTNSVQYDCLSIGLVF